MSDKNTAPSCKPRRNCSCCTLLWAHDTVFKIMLSCTCISWHPAGTSESERIARMLLKVSMLNLGFPSLIWHAAFPGQTEEKSSCAKDRVYAHCFKLRYVRSSSAFALSWSESFQEYWVQGRNISWMGLQFITEHHVHTHSKSHPHLQATSYNQSRCRHECGWLEKTSEPVGNP